MERILPEDIILNIFSRVPFESVFECRLVSKTWKYFITHLSKVHKSSSSSDSKLSFISLNMLQNHTFQLLHSEYPDETNNNEQQLRVSKMNHPLIRRAHYRYIWFGDTPNRKFKSVIIGSSNGLLCLSLPRDGKHGAVVDPLYICNPITREYIFLPICGTERCAKGRNVFGFGYNDKTDEYKVVRIYYESEKHTEPGQVQVYTLGAGTGWRNKGEVVYSLQTNNSYSPGMNADGEVYWLHQEILEKDSVPGEMRRSNQGRVVAFNLADEVFRLLPEPPYYTPLPGGKKIAIFAYHQIQVLRDRLCYIHKVRYDTINIWSFEKKNIDGSICSSSEDSSNWSLAGTVQLEREHLARFFDLTKSGEVLYWDDKKTASIYDPRTAGVKVLWNDGTTGLEVFETIRHDSTFVSLKALGEENVKMFGPIN